MYKQVPPFFTRQGWQFAVVSAAGASLSPGITYSHSDPADYGFEPVTALPKQTSLMDRDSLKKIRSSLELSPLLPSQGVVSHPKSSLINLGNKLGGRII